MATPPTIWREPESIAAGDTLIFQKFLNGYLPADGWSIHGTVTDPTSALEVASYQSVQSTTNLDCHSVNVNNFAAAVPQGSYILSEEVVNSGTGEKHQIYYAELEIGPDLNDQTATAPILTTAQRMIQTLEATLLDLYQRKMRETNVQRSQFILKEHKEVETSLFKWREIRKNEENEERIVNGGSSRNDFRPVLRMS